MDIFLFDDNSFIPQDIRPARDIEEESNKAVGLQNSGDQCLIPIF